ncbi:hypothetical protein BDV24DRAFT_73168 [Aspergillus arachidicola]|uniref:Uncharacterized protein n=1 Tax=Aspergillus arachidicola TaxID=656916 RepID=A0A5N6Y2B9_9EURO|nr:hypothetical protein BDV24DRAFT_73168 [Aspergillus arachidicola]
MWVPMKDPRIKTFNTAGEVTFGKTPSPSGRPPFDGGNQVGPLPCRAECTQCTR